MGRLIYRQSAWTRATHWVWAICLFFLVLSGLQIFNAHPALYIGQESGFAYDNAVLRIDAVRSHAGPRGRTQLFGTQLDTTGILGVSGSAERPRFQAFPGAVTIPSYRDLATGRLVHFFFAWVFVAALVVWLAAGLVNGHVRRELLPTGADLRNLPQNALDHARFRFHHGQHYNPMQKLSYFGVLFILFPLMVLTGLAMSPAINAAWPWLLEVFGGRQTARTIHFVVMLLLVLFFIVHILMVLAAGPVNELRSMITGWYRLSPESHARAEEKP